MMKRLLLVLAAMVLPGALAAQGGTTREQIERAKQLYNNFQVETARPILLSIISPNYLQPITSDERVEAYKYLGASYALLDKRDSAKIFFTAAVDFDPFTDLDVESFSAAELSAFNEAKGSLFKVGVAGIRNKTIRPREDSTAYQFRIITTSRGFLTVVVMSQPDTTKVREVLFQDSYDGLRQVSWNGVLRSGQFADTGIYVVKAIGTRDGSVTPATAQQFFRLEHHHDAIEDTLPPFRPEELLQDRIPASAPYLDLVKGFLTAAAAGAVASLTLNSDVKGWEPHVAGAALMGLVAGGWSFLYRRQNRTIRANAEENARRQARREEFNRGVRERNAQRLEARWVIISPIAGFGR